MTAATTPKGERRRAALVAAAGELLVEGGFDRVRHRSVAQRAQIPLAATTYYFESLEDLLISAVTYAGCKDIDAISARVGSIARRRRGAVATADAIAAVLFPVQPDHNGGQAVVSRYERMVVSARDPALVAVQSEIRRQLLAIHLEVLGKSGRELDERRVLQLMSVEDGAAVGAFGRLGASVHDSVKATVAEVIDTLAPAVSWPTPAL